MERKKGDGALIELAGRNGVRLRAEVCGGEAAPPVLLLHGGGQTRHAWGGTAQALAEDGWCAVSVDLRGHGDSEWAPDGDYAFEAFADDVDAIARTFAEPPVLVGASLGGIASLIAVGQRGTPARALVLVDVGPKIEVAGAERVLEFMTSRPDGFASLEDAADAVAGYMPHRERPRDLGGLAKNLRQGEDGRYRWHWDPRFIVRNRPRVAAEGFGDGMDDAARSLRIPTLLVRGKLSDLLSEEGARHFLELAPHAKYADVTGAGHMVAGDRNDLFTRAVRDFLRDVQPEGAANRRT
ncbi:MAG TPA: alpha/beta hydrolase [Myxococcota bacterium]|nr:alpha/beta hydrolase [Myxococcota bacterium]